MKKIFKILLISLVAVLGAFSMFACAGGDNNQGGDQTPSTGVTLPDVIGGYEGEYEVPANTAFGEIPDLDNVIIDGKLDDELWQNKNWYVQYQPLNPDFKFEVTTAFSEKGVYVAAKSNDKYVYWLDRNKFYGNTYMKFRFVSNENGGNNKSIQIDANNTPPTGDIVNVRSTYQGEINNPGKSNGLYVEMFITWEQIGFSQPQEYIDITPVYNYKVQRNDDVKGLYNTFVVTESSDNAALEFDTNGYTGVDDPNTSVGNHQRGLSKSTGWKVEIDENGKETASVQCNDFGGTMGYTPKNFTQAIFFKEANVATRFMIKTRLTVNNNAGYTRAGLLMYRTSMNYRAYGLEIGDEFDSADKEFNRNKVNVKAWTNFPSDIVTPTTCGTFTNTTADGRAKNQVDLSVFNNSGRIYYFINNQFIYSEVATYVGENCFLGLYAYNADVTFSDYEFKTYNNDEELSLDIREYIYTAEVYNNTYECAEVELSQIACLNDGTGSVDVIMNFNAPFYDARDKVVKHYVLESLSYNYINADGEKVEVDVTEDAMQKTKAGVYTIANVPGNITIEFYGKAVVLDDYVNVELKFINDQTGKPVTGGIITLKSTGVMTNYLFRFNNMSGCFSAPLPKGYAWDITLNEDGYRPYAGVLNNANPINQDMSADNPEEFVITATVVGGSAIDSKGMTIGASAPGQYWDMTEEDNSKVTFTSTNTGSSYIYFSGPTVSDYQVAYVEITNRTDYTAFRSIEDDPAAGFCITGVNGKTSRALLWKTGVRIINDPSLSWSDGVKSMDKGCNYPGHIAVIDRNNGGAVAGIPYLGTGTINRVPYGNTTHTTSFLMIRKGGSIFLYAADGRAGLTAADSQTELQSKMRQIHSYYNPIVTGNAAVGFAITVSFNLRLDFENYWIMTGDKAEAFADDLITADVQIQGSDIVDVKANGQDLDGYNESTGKGKVAIGSTVEIAYKDKLGAFPEGKLLKVTLPNGTSQYISSKSGKASFTVDSKLITWKAQVELVDAVEITGKILPPTANFSLAGLDGVIKDEAGIQVATFTTSPTGTFSAVVEGGRKYTAHVNVPGYASDKKEFTATNGVNIGDISLETLNIGAAGTANGVIYGKDDDLGVYAQYHNGDARNAAIMLKAETMQNFVFEYTYYRSAKQPGELGGADETDLGIGMIIRSDSDEVQMMNMSDGYRILTNRTEWATRFESRGKGGANVQPTTISPDNAITIKFIKVGGVIYMYNKYANDQNFRHINTWNCASNSNDSTPICTGPVSVGIWWTTTAGRFLNLTFYDISLSEVNEQTAPEVYGKISVASAVNGTLVANDTSGKAIANGTTLAGGTDVVIVATPAAGYKVKALYINDRAVVLTGYTGGTLNYNHVSAGDTNVRVEFEVATKQVTIQLTETESYDIDSVKILVEGALYSTMSVSTNANRFSETCAHLSGLNLKMILPERVVTIQLLDADGGVLRTINDYQV